MTHVLSHFRFCPHCGSDRFLPNNIKSKRCDHCGFVYYLNPSAACAAIIREKGSGRILVAIRANEPAKGMYDLPGGFSDLNECSEESILREVAEEISPKLVEDAADTLRFLFSRPNLYLYSGMTIPTMDMIYLLEVEDLSPYVGEGRDDVESLIALHPDEIDPERFGFDSIRRAFVKYRDMSAASQRQT